MNFGFNFAWPPYVGSVIGILASLLVLAGAVVWGLLLVRRLILAWRGWGKPEVLGAFASRAELLKDGIGVVGLREGKQVGRVNDVILNLQTGCVAGFRVRARWRKRLLPFGRVKSIGRDAITVESADELRLPAALPELDMLAVAKYRWDECEVVTEGGLRLGTTSWRDLWYNRTTGSVELAVESSYQSLINSLLAWAIELASVCQPLDDWIDRPGHLSVRVPLRTIRSASRGMIVISAEGGTQFQEAVQAQARLIRESISTSYGKLKTLRSWRPRGSSGPSANPGLGASVTSFGPSTAAGKERIAAPTESANP
jgi:uncharacterized protein YrrD